MHRRIDNNVREWLYDDILEKVKRRLKNAKINLPKDLLSKEVNNTIDKYVSEWKDIWLSNNKDSYLEIFDNDEEALAEYAELSTIGNIYENYGDELCDEIIKSIIIQVIMKLYRSKIGRIKGIIMKSYKGMEVGIRTYNYDIIGKDGLYCGYWTDPKPRLAERTIVSRIISTEDCQDWESLEEKELRGAVNFLRSYNKD